MAKKKTTKKRKCKECAVRKAAWAAELARRISLERKLEALGELLIDLEIVRDD